MYESSDKNIRINVCCFKKLLKIDDLCLRCLLCMKEYSFCCGVVLINDGNGFEKCSNLLCQKKCFQINSVSKCCRSYLVDNREGYEVCSQCGLVNDVYIGTSSNKFNEIVINTNDKSSQSLRDICINNHITQELTKDIIQTFKDVKQKYSNKNIHNYAIYETFIKHKVNRSQEEVNEMCGNGYNTIPKIIKNLGLSSIVSTDCFSSVLIARLNLPFSWNKKVFRILNFFDFIDFKPKTVNAIAIFILCVHFKQKSIENINYPNLSKITETCKCSKSSIQRYIQLLTKKNIINMPKSVFKKKHVKLY